MPKYDRLQRWATLVNAGMADGAAARAAGYAESTARNPGRIRALADRRGLLHSADAAALARDLIDEVLADPDTLRGILQSLARRATAGDIAAIREALDRLLGKPVQRQDVTTHEDQGFDWAALGFGAWEEGPGEDNPQPGVEALSGRGGGGGSEVGEDDDGGGGGG